MPTRVLHVLNTLETGGAEYLVLNLARCVDRSRFELAVCSMEGDGDLGEQFRRLGFETFFLDRRKGLDPTLTPKLARLIRRERVDVVHTHNVAPWLYSAPAARLSGADLCHTEHSTLLPGQTALMRAERVLGLLTKAVICDGEQVRRQLVDDQRLSPRNVVTIYNGVDTELYGRPVDAAAGRRALGLSGEAPVVGTVARLQPVKDQVTLLEAFSAVAARLPAARLVLVGEGPARPALERRAAFPDLAGRVLFLGRRTDVATLLPLFDLFVLSSLSEGLPLTLLEAMAAGLACVSTAVGAISEVILQESTGLLVPARDPAALAQALERLLRDEARRRTMGQAGRARARALFDLKVMTRRYQDLWAA
jgi:glycosyltransferase involved in cell wall biosynthesis